MDQEYIGIYLNRDGSLAEKSVGNVFQFTNEFVGVRLYSPYSSADVLTFINIQLPDGTVLEERGMVIEGSVEEDGVTWYAWTYIFPEIVTSQSNGRFSSAVIIAFRTVDNATSRSMNSALIPITIQPSIKGDKAEITDTTRYEELLYQINKLIVDKQNINDDSLETENKRVPDAINELLRKIDGNPGEPGTVDKQMSDTSTNAVQNKVIKAYVDDQINESIVKVINTEV